MTGTYARRVRVLVASEVVLRIRGLVLIPVLTKHFGSSNYGVWAQVSVIISMLGPLVAMGLDSAVLRFAPGTSRSEIAKSFSTVFAYLICASSLVGLALVVCSAPIARAFFETSDNARFVAICGLSVSVNLLLNQCRNYSRVVDSARGYAALALAQGASNLLVGVGVSMLHGSVWTLVCVTLALDTVLLIVAASVVFTDIGVARPSWELFVRYARYGLPLVPAGYAMWALNSSDRLFLAHYKSMDEIGVYAVVYSLGYMLIATVFNPIWLMYPARAADAFNRNDVEGVRTLFRTVTKAALGLLIPLTVGLAVLARPALELLTSAEFSRGAPWVVVVTLAYVFSMMSSFFDVNLGLVHRQWWSVVSISIAMTVNIGCNFFMVPWLGLGGAALTTLLGFSIQCCVSSFVSNRYLPMPFDGRFLVKTIAASAVMALVMLLFSPARPISGPSRHRFFSAR